MTSLTAEQKSFLEECALEFADRFTNSDLEYKQVYDSDIPPPPIMCPWYGRPKLTANRFRGASGSRSQDRGYSHEDNFKNRDNYRENRDYKYQNRRHRPY